jgi:hypothetical protein
VARAQFSTTVLDASGTIQPSEPLVLYETDGATPFGQPVYDVPSGGTPVPSPQTDAEGQVILYADAGQYLTYRVDGGELEYGRMDPDPADLVLLDAVQTVDAKTLTDATMVEGRLTSATPNPAATFESTFSGVSYLSLTAAGSGYTSAPTVSITGGGGSGATAIATVSAGVVTALTLTAPGTGYTSWPSVAITGGGGSGATGQANLSYPVLTGIVAGAPFFNLTRAYDTSPQLFLQQGRLIVNHTSLDDSSEVMVNFDFTNTMGAGSDAGTMTVVAAEGKMIGRDGGSYTPTGRSDALRGIEVRGMWGTWAGLIAAGHGASRHGIGIGIETNTARNDAGVGTYAGEQGALYVQASTNPGLFLDAPANTSPNYALNIGGDTNATATTCAFEWPIYVTGTVQTPAVFAVYRDGSLGLAKTPVPGHGGRLQVNQKAGDDLHSGIRVFRNGSTTEHSNLFTGGDGSTYYYTIIGADTAYLRVQPQGAGSTLHVVAAAGHTGLLLDAQVNGVSKMSVAASGTINVTAGGVYLVNTQQVVGARQAAVQDVISANATDVTTACLLANEIKVRMNQLLPLLRANTGHGLLGAYP